MKVAFFGTPEFALPSLAALCASSHEVTGVVSAPDQPVGRGLILNPPPVAQAARRLSLPLLQPENLRDADFLKQLRAFEADVFAVVAFRILPEEIFQMPRLSTINLHASLLPAYRGAAPIVWALWNGEKETGLTTFRIEKTVDTGNILQQVKVKIQDDDDAGSLSQRLSEVGANLLLETLTELEQGKLTPISQNPALATPAPKITKEHCLIDWRHAAVQIHNQIRALAPEPAAFTNFMNQTLKIFRSAVDDDHPQLDSGAVQINDQTIMIGTGQGNLLLTELQLQGKKRLDAKSFLRGFRPRGRFQIQP